MLIANVIKRSSGGGGNVFFQSKAIFPKIGKICMINNDNLSTDMEAPTKHSRRVYTLPTAKHDTKNSIFGCCLCVGALMFELIDGCLIQYY